MKILQVNKFFYVKGGAERCMFGVSELLKANGHTVAFFSMEHKNNAESEWKQYFTKNVEYNKKHAPAEQIKIFMNTLYSYEARYKIERLLDNFDADIAHIHNFSHQIN